MDPKVFLYDVKCCRNCANGHKYRVRKLAEDGNQIWNDQKIDNNLKLNDGQQTCMHPEVVSRFIKKPEQTFDIIKIDGVAKGVCVFDHVVCNFHEFRPECAEAEKSYYDVKEKIKEYRKLVLTDLHREAEKIAAKKYGIKIKKER